LEVGSAILKEKDRNGEKAAQCQGSGGPLLAYLSILLSDKHFSPDLDFSAVEVLEKFALYNLR
jgi:hypothetical protein